MVFHIVDTLKTQVRFTQDAYIRENLESRLIYEFSMNQLGHFYFVILINRLLTCFQKADDMFEPH